MVLTRHIEPPQGFNEDRAFEGSIQFYGVQIPPPQGISTGEVVPSAITALVQTGTLTALVQTGTLTALVQTVI